MNKLAVLAFALLLFFSTMLWYLANGSLNEYLKSQVLLQSQYYSGQKSELLSADFSNNTGITQLTNLSISNIDGLTQPKLLNIDEISVQLEAVPTSEFDAPSVQKKTSTLVHVKEVRLSNVDVWSELTKSGDKNLALLIEKINTTLATDYPALYPEISAELYAKKYPERSETLALAELETSPKAPEIETNKAIIASKEAKQKKRLLGKAITRVKVSSVIIEQLTITSIKDGATVTHLFTNIELGSLGNENGLDSNQLGGELLRRLLEKLITLENSPAQSSKDNQ